VSDKLTTACNVLLSLPLLAILRTSTHWRQSQIQHDRLCRSPPCQIRLCRKSTKSTVSLWPCTHWRQRNSTRSTLSKSTMSNYTLTQVNKVNRVALALYTLATKEFNTIDFVEVHRVIFDFAASQQSRPCRFGPVHTGDKGIQHDQLCRSQPCQITL